jgi:GT2 family glycosyltransferase
VLSLDARLAEATRRLERCAPAGKAAPRPRSLAAALPTTLVREAVLLGRSGSFDAAHYLRTYPDVAPGRLAPLLHFLRFGWREHRTPHPLFDTGYYLARYPDVAAAGTNPFVHFLRAGLTESRDPAACFRTADYRARHPDLAAENPLLHFLRVGFDRPQDCRVSIVIHRFGQPDLTLRCLASLACLRDAAAHEVIVVDDCSPDDSSHPVNTLPGVVRLRQRANRGFAASCNAGAGLARGEYLVFLNNDTEVHNGWLDNLLRTFVDHPGTGLAGSKLLQPDGRLQEAGSFIWRDGSGCNYGRGDDPCRPEYNFVRETDSCSGASIMIRTDLFRSLGGYSEEYSPAFFEDADLAFRVRQAGWKVCYQPFSELVHVEGATRGRDENCGLKRHQAAIRRTFAARWRLELAARPEPIAWPFPLASAGEAARVLVVDSWVPTPDRDSGSVRMLHLLEALRGLGYSVCFAPQNARHSGAYTEELQRRGIECLYRPDYPSLRRTLARRAGEFDLFWVAQYDHLEEVYDPLRRLAPGVPIVLDTVDLHFLRLERQAAQTGRREDRRLAARARRDELSLAAACEAVVVVSEAEQELLARLLPGQRVHVISNAHAPHPAPQGPAGRRGALFVGGFNHPPNLDAVRWLAGEIWPLVVASRPDARLFIVGSNPPEWLAQLRTPGVEVLGHVPDLAPWYESVALSVAPLRFGAGVKGKIGESLSRGVPVVSTSIGAEGMHTLESPAMLVADTAPAFADAVLRLMDDPQVWRSLSAAGRLTVERDFSPAAQRRSLEALLRALGLSPAGPGRGGGQPDPGDGVPTAPRHSPEDRTV